MPIEAGAIAAALPHYQIGSEIGRGGWGVVVSARHRQLERAVAIKQLPPVFAVDPLVRERFVSEARLVASLDHPHIVRVYDYVERDELCLLVMERLDGGTVWERFTGRGVTAIEACAIAVATCAALDAAHRRGILHRDVKPSNLMFASDGTIKVTDFGIAQVLGGASSMATRDGSVLGTPAYMAPEQAQNHVLTPATDVYAVGTVLYELLTGTLPFDTGLGALQVLYAHAFTPPRPVLDAAPTLAAPLAEVVMRAVATGPAERQQSAEELGVAIAQAAARVWGPGWLLRSRIPLLTGGPIAAAALQPTGPLGRGAPPTEAATGVVMSPATGTGAGVDAVASAGAGLDAFGSAGAAPADHAQTGPALSPVRPAGSRERPPGVDATMGPRDLVPLDEMVQPGGVQPGGVASATGASPDGASAPEPKLRGRGRLMVGGSIALVAAVAGTALGLVASDGPGGRRKAAGPPSTTTVAGAGPVVAAPPPTCPLSGLPAPGGAVPRRPALAIKVDNVAAARPPSGLDQADVVFEEPIEGLTTRFLAVFQCQSADVVGDVRSARAVDAPVLDQLSRPIFVHVGGIGPVLSLIAHANDLDADLTARGPGVQNPPGRFAPYDTYVSTAAAWGLHANDTSPPAPLFTYATAPPAGRAVTSVRIPYSETNDTTWAWDPAARQWLRSYGGAPATLADGSRLRAANVVVQVVQVSYGPWAEDANHGLEVQSQLIGSGPLVVFRDGVEVAGTWQRAAEGDPTALLGPGGAPIPLAPGGTWVEIVPSSVTVSAVSTGQ